MSSRGHYTHTQLTFTLNGKEYTYSGRGRWSIPLTAYVFHTKTMPKMTDTNGVKTWTWVTASQDILDNLEIKKHHTDLLPQATIAASV